MTFGSELLAAACGGAEVGSATASLRHVAEIPARTAESCGWPTWATEEVLAAGR